MCSWEEEEFRVRGQDRQSLVVDGNGCVQGYWVGCRGERVQNEESKRKKCRDHANAFSGSESLFQNGEQALEDF